MYEDVYALKCFSSKQPSLKSSIDITDVEHMDIYNSFHEIHLFVTVCESISLQLVVNNKVLMFHMVAARGGRVTVIRTRNA